MLTLFRIEILDLEIPFRFTFRHALAARSKGHSVLVRASDRDGRVGWGECVPRPYVTRESPDSVRSALREILVPQFLGCSFATFAEVAGALESRLMDLPAKKHAAWCALELALLDLAGRVFARSAGEELVGPLVAGEVAYSAVVSADSLDASVATLREIQRSGFEKVKLKVGLGRDQDLRLLAEARAILGEACGLRIDANCAWAVEEALAMLEAFLPFRLESVEQPVAADDIEGLAWLTARSPIPVIVDESLASKRDARRLIDRGACHGFNIRISKCGGLIGSVRLRDLARSAGIGYQLGAQVGETALLSAAGRQFATRSSGMLACEGSYGRVLLEADIGIQDITVGRGGKAPALSGPGLGVDVDPERVARYTTGRFVLGGN